MKNKMTAIVSFLILVMAGFLIVLLVYWRVYPYKVVTINEVKVLTPVVKAGDYVWIFLDSVKHIGIPCRIITQMVNGHPNVLSEERSNVKVGPFKGVLKIKIPNNSSSDKNCMIRRTYLYDLNPIREIPVAWQTPPFEVIGMDVEIKIIEKRQVDIINNQDKILKALKKNNVGPPGPQGEKGERGPGLFGK
jgi:hypothetical protein